MRRLVR